MVWWNTLYWEGGIDRRFGMGVDVSVDDDDNVCVDFGGTRCRSREAEGIFFGKVAMGWLVGCLYQNGYDDMGSSMVEMEGDLLMPTI